MIAYLGRIGLVRPVNPSPSARSRYTEIKVIPTKRTYIRNNLLDITGICGSTYGFTYSIVIFVINSRSVSAVIWNLRGAVQNQCKRSDCAIILLRTNLKANIHDQICTRGRRNTSWSSICRERERKVIWSDQYSINEPH